MDIETPASEPFFARIPAADESMDLLHPRDLRPVRYARNPQATIRLSEHSLAGGRKRVLARIDELDRHHCRAPALQRPTVYIESVPGEIWVSLGGKDDRLIRRRREDAEESVAGHLDRQLDPLQRGRHRRAGKRDRQRIIRCSLELAVTAVGERERRPHQIDRLLQRLVLEIDLAVGRHIRVVEPLDPGAAGDVAAIGDDRVARRAARPVAVRRAEP